VASVSPKVVVVGLGPAGPELLTIAARDAVAAVPVRFVRTTRHPAAVAVPDAVSLDAEYDGAARQEDVYPAIVDRLVAAAAEHGTVLYAVPGSPAVAERSVVLLRADGRVEVELVPGLSFLDLAWSRLGVDPLAEGVRVVDGARFTTDAAGERGPLLVSHCDRRSVLSEIKLAVDDPPSEPVTVLQRLGLPDESVTEVAWADLDRVVEPDHLTSLWIPRLAAPVAGEVVRFDELVRRLRADCPWDRQQTHRSLTRHLLEEAYEVLEAIEALDPDEPTAEQDAHLEEELGDLLFQVAFHARLGAERGSFTLADVARGVHDKLVGRHPHVFADVAVAGADDVVRNWEQIKKEEKGRASVFDGIPGTLPSLLYAAKVQRKAASLGVDPDPPSTVDVADLVGDEAVGDVLYAVVAAARRAGVDPEAALRGATARARDAAAALEAAT
jgi:tetrapyrrole methylase family protein / MazG family protein